jgi:hypothetical protein
VEPLAFGVLIGLVALLFLYRARRRAGSSPPARRVDGDVPKREAIRSALQALATRSNEDAFVFLEDSRTRKWVQFAGGAGRPLLFDLPAMALGAEEMARAVDFFKEFGRGSLESFELGKRAGGVPFDRGETYQIRFDSNEIDAATDAALAVFERVYRLPEGFPLAIDEN